MVEYLPSKQGVAGSSPVSRSSALEFRFKGTCFCSFDRLSKMLTQHCASWPKRAPHALTIPETTIYYNLDVSATRYPNKTAIVYYRRAITHRELARVSAVARR